MQARVAAVARLGVEVRAGGPRACVRPGAQAPLVLDALDRCGRALVDDAAAALTSSPGRTTQKPAHVSHPLQRKPPHLLPRSVHPPVEPASGSAERAQERCRGRRGEHDHQERRAPPDQHRRHPERRQTGVEHELVAVATVWVTISAASSGTATRSRVSRSRARAGGRPRTRGRSPSARRRSRSARSSAGPAHAPALRASSTPGTTAASAAITGTPARVYGTRASAISAPPSAATGRTGTAELRREQRQERRREHRVEAERLRVAEHPAEQRAGEPSRRSSRARR